MYVDEATAAQLFASAERKSILGDVSAPVPRPEHLLAMKAVSMKNAPRRVLIDSPDVDFLLRLPGVDRAAVRDSSGGMDCWSCSMRSNDNLDLAEFLTGMPTTAADIAALDRARAFNRLDPVEYLRFLEQFSAKHPPTREIPERHEPFTL